MLAMMGSKLTVCPVYRPLPSHGVSFRVDISGRNRESYVMHNSSITAVVAYFQLVYGDVNLRQMHDQRTIVAIHSLGVTHIAFVECLPILNDKSFCSSRNVACNTLILSFTYMCEVLTGCRKWRYSFLSR